MFEAFCSELSQVSSSLLAGMLAFQVNGATVLCDGAALMKSADFFPQRHSKAILPKSRWFRRDLGKPHAGSAISELWKPRTALQRYRSRLEEARARALDRITAEGEAQISESHIVEKKKEGRGRQKRIVPLEHRRKKNS